jgi:hypothetical protein
VLPALGWQWMAAACGVDERELGLPGAARDQAADAGEANSGEGARDGCAGPGGEEKFVVFAAMKRGVEAGWAVGKQRAGAVVDGDGGGVELGGDAGSGAEVGEVGGETIAEVDGGGGEPVAQELPTEAKPGLREEVRGPRGLDGRGVVAQGWLGFGLQGSCEELAELGGGSAEGVGDVEEIAGMRAVAAKGAAGGDGAEENDVGQDEVRGGFAGIAAGEGDFAEPGEGEEAVEEGVEPALVAGYGLWQGEREERGEGTGTHGGEVGEPAGEGAMADASGGVEVAAEVAAFEGEVGGDDDFMAAGDAEDGAVVADAERDGAAASAGVLPDALDERELAGGGWLGHAWSRVADRSARGVWEGVGGWTWLVF